RGEKTEKAIASMPVGQTLDDFVQQQERNYIEATLSHCGGSREKAASTLGISMATLYRKVEPKTKKEIRSRAGQDRDEASENVFFANYPRAGMDGLAGVSQMDSEQDRHRAFAPRNAGSARRHPERDRHRHSRCDGEGNRSATKRNDCAGDSVRVHRSLGRLSWLLHSRGRCLPGLRQSRFV